MAKSLDNDVASGFFANANTRKREIIITGSDVSNNSGLYNAAVAGKDYISFYNDKRRK